LIISQILKIEICKEVLEKLGNSHDKNHVDTLVLSVMNDRFLFELQNNEIVAFVTWKNPQIINGKNTVFIENLWIDPRYRNFKYGLKIRTLLRNMFKDTKGIWFNRRKQKMIERS
jgi:hypothetical protein